MLLDGGATHCLRCAKDEEEWQAAEVTTLQLAAGSIQLRQDRDSGTLLTMDRSVQPIIPLADLTRIGVEISWSTDRCKMVRSDGRVLPTHLDGGCPVISKREGEKLMQEIEAYHRHRCGIRRVYAYTDATRGEGLCGDEDAKRCLEMKALFPNIPAHIAERVPGTVDFDVNKIPFNRRQRKKVMEASTLVLHVFSGKQTRVWSDMEENGLVILCVELEKGANLLNDDLYGWLEYLARRGKFDMIIGGPPCRSVSLQRHRGDGGPRPVRGRYNGYHNSRFGLVTSLGSLHPLFQVLGPLPRSLVRELLSPSLTALVGDPDAIESNQLLTVAEDRCGFWKPVAKSSLIEARRLHSQYTHHCLRLFS